MKSNLVIAAILIWTYSLSALDLVHEDLIGGRYEDVVIYNDYLYAATRYGVQSFDISDPAHVIPIEHQKFQGVEYVMLMDTILVAVGKSPNRVLTFSLSNPESPELLDQVQTGSFSSEPIIINGFLYGPAQYNGVRIVSLLNPGNLEYIGNFHGDINFALKCETSDGLLYVMDHTRGRIGIFSLENPGEPQLQRNFSPNIAPIHFSIHDHYMYCNSLDGVISVFQINDTDEPFFVGQQNFNREFTYNQIVNDQIWLKSAHDLCIFSLDDPVEPRLIKEIEWYGDVLGCDWNDDIVALGGQFNVYFDIWDSDSLNQISHFENPRGCEAFAVNQPFIYVMNEIFSDQYFQILYTIEQTGFSETEILDSIGVFGGMLMNMVIWQDYIYCMFSDSLRILDCSDPRHPEFTGSYGALDGYGGRYYGMSIINGFMVTYQNTIIRINSLDDPEHPEEISSYHSERDMSCPSDNDPVGDFIYIMTGDYLSTRYLEVISLEDPYNPAFVNEIVMNEHFFNHSGVRCGNYFIIGNHTAHQNYIFDISDPENPEFVFQMDNASGRGTCANDSMFVTCTSRDAATSLYTLNDEGIPQLYARTELGDGSYALTEDQLICGTDISLMFFDLEPTGISTNEDPAVLQNHDLISCYPNPFNSTINISFNIPVQDDVVLTIFDSSGRMVTDLIDQKLTAGEHRFGWDATGLVSGQYYCLLKAGNQSCTQKLLLIK